MAERRMDEGTKQIEVLFKKSFRQLYVRAFGWLNDEEAAKDVVLDAFAYLCEHQDRYTDHSHYLALLYHLVYTRAMDQLRLRQRKLRFLANQIIDDEAQAPDFFRINDFHDYEQRLEKVNAIIDELSPRMKTAFVNSVLQRKTYSETANEMGVAPETVKTMIRRAYRILRDKLIFLVFLCTPIF
jgi:RNA polymerase sigma factor (sigma-70 family)